MSLKELRTSKGIYPSFVAKKLKISTRHFHRIENGEGYMTEKRAKILSKLYCVRVSEIMNMYGGEKLGRTSTSLRKSIRGGK